MTEKEFLKEKGILKLKNGLTVLSIGNFIKQKRNEKI